MMKRVISMLLAVVMLLSLVGCEEQKGAGNIKEAGEKTDAVIELPDYTASAQDLMTIIDEVCQARYEEICTPIEEDNFADFLVNDPSTADLLSDEEIEQLVDYSRGSRSGSLSLEEARADISLLFRTLRSSYGAYYYIGEDRFAAAEEELYQLIEGKGVAIGIDELNYRVVNTLSFIEDAHFSIYNDSGNIDNFNDSAIRWEYFYCEGYEFEKDESGFYQVDDEGVKWYVSDISDDRVTIERTLMSDGRIVYAPVLFCTRPAKQNSRITLTAASGENKEYDLAWKENKPVVYGDVYRLIQNGEITYLSIQDFNNDLESILTQYVADASLTRDSKVIIYDLRSNRGGGGWSRDWVANYLDVPANQIQLKTLFSNRSSKLFDALGYSFPAAHGCYENNTINGIWHENDVPIIVLTDDRCGSSGEDAISFLKTLDNVIVIGSNSAGYQLCGNVRTIRLPYSGLYFQFGCSFQFKEKIENVDYRGYKPDVWCNPADALGAALNMLSYYDLAEEEELAPITEEMNAYHEISVRMPGGFIVQQETGFGTVEYETHLTVLADGEKTSDYTVKNGNDRVCSVEKSDDGELIIRNITPGDSWITITCEKSSARFRWHNDSYGAPEKAETTKAPAVEDERRETGFYLRFQSSYDVFPGERFGGGGPESSFTVMYNGKMIKDFTLENENEDVCTLKKLATGKVLIQRVEAGKTGSSWITITYEGETASFHWTQYR